MKKEVLLALTLLMVFSTAAFQADLESKKKIADSKSPAVFHLDLENTGSENQSYSLSLLSPKSSWFYYPSSVKIRPGENKTLKITVSPVKNAIQQRYRFDLKIREVRTGETEQFKGFFRVKQPYRIQIVKVEKNREKLRPGEVLKTSIRIRNLDNQPIENYNVSTTFDNHTRFDTGTPILSGGERIFNFKFRVDKDEKPGTKQINYTIYSENKIERTTAKKVNIKAVENISRNFSAENTLLTYIKSSTVVNTGNSPVNTSITFSIPSYLSSITVESPKAEEVTEVNGKTVHTWRTTLQPGEKFSASYRTRYWIPLLGIILLVVGIAAIKKIGGNIQIVKKAQEKDGEIKIELEIQNTSEKTFENLEIEEFIPDISTVDENFDMNTPKIRKTSEGTKLNWKIDDLNPGDQRIIQYKIKPKVSVEEEVELDTAKIKDRNGQKIAESNKVQTEFQPDTT